MFLIIVEHVIAFTRAFAIADMVFEADFVFAALNVFGTKVIVACPQWIKLADHVEYCINRFKIGIRAKIFGAVLDLVPRREDA